MLFRREFILLSIFSFALCNCSYAAEQGIKLRFVISAKRTEQNSPQQIRSYENAVLMSFGKVFSASFEEEFRISLAPTEDSSGIKVKIGLRDLRRAGMDVGETTATVAPGGSADVLISMSDTYTYRVLLLADWHDLPAKSP